MDPNETYRLWTIALLEENPEEAKELYLALKAWLARGGFEPDVFEAKPYARRQFHQFDMSIGRL